MKEKENRRKKEKENRRKKEKENRRKKEHFIHSSYSYEKSADERCNHGSIHKSAVSASGA
jgi:hypothetical protein